MKGKIILVLFLLVVGFAVVFYFFNANSNKTFSNKTSLENNEKDISQETHSLAVNVNVEEVVGDLKVPWSIVFTSENRILVTERTGAIRIVENALLLPQPLITLSEVSPNAEAGLMGMTLHPNYQSNKQFYVCYAYQNQGSLFDKVVRMIDKGSSAEVDTVILDRIPAAQFHAGCELAFGPDDKLYVTTGDATDGDLAQDLSSLAGKILRLNPDGSIPQDNPFQNSYVYSYGHRNPQGITWSARGIMLSTEHGPSGFDGPPGGDEINVIEAGKNYGWPEVSHTTESPEYQNPVTVFTPAVAPASAQVYTGELFPQFKGNLFFAGLRGTALFRVIFTDETYTEIASIQEMPQVEFGRIREVKQSPNGEIYFTTSNTDGRGDPAANDDKIYKLVVE